MDIIKNFLYPNKNDILDPLSLVIKLYIYSYKSVGTKISILNNRVVIQEIGPFQSTVRAFNGDTKNDLINIMFPLTYACEYYLADIYNQKYRRIFEQITKSFDKLNEIYQVNEINLNIEQLRSIVNNFLSDNKFNPKTVILNWDDPSAVLKKTFYEQTNSIWTTDRVDILFGFLNEINVAETEELHDYLIYSLSVYMNFIDMVVVKLINNLHLLR